MTDLTHRRGRSGIAVLAAALGAILGTIRRRTCRRSPDHQR
jgi:hypothetical protein